MRTLWNTDDRAAIVARLARLTAGHRAQWGRMTAPQVVVHLADALRMAFGDLPTRPKNTPVLRHFPLKHLVLYMLPFPRGAPTARELLERQPGDWDTELADCRALVERFGREPATRTWPVHPAFGTLSASQWGLIAYRHTDHHLRQFGV